MKGSGQSVSDFTPITGDAVGQSVAVQPDGKILIAGRNFTTSTVATAIRLNADGSADNAFGTNGWLNTDLATGTFDFWFGLTLSWDGKMYLSGTASGDFAAGRYNTFDGFFDGASTHMDQRLWYQQDANFNVTSVSNDAGVVVERYVYAPYGERTALDSGFTPVAGGASLFGVDEGHQGLSADAETGLVYNRHRYLHVTLGRFTSPDPHPQGRYVDGMNGYEYVRGGPVGAVDPLGTSTLPMGNPVSPLMPWISLAKGVADAIDLAYENNLSPDFEVIGPYRRNGPETCPDGEKLVMINSEEKVEIRIHFVVYPNSSNSRYRTPQKLSHTKTRSTEVTYACVPCDAKRQAHWKKVDPPEEPAARFGELEPISSGMGGDPLLRQDIFAVRSRTTTEKWHYGSDASGPPQPPEGYSDFRP